jgi:hypothetical protein
MCEAKLKNIRGSSAQATKLRSPTVSGWLEREELPSMKTLLSLVQLRADGCVKLKSMPGFGAGEKAWEAACSFVLSVRRGRRC